MKGRRVVFTGKNVVEVEDYEQDAPSAGQLLVKSKASLISAGTEISSLTGDTGMGPPKFPQYPGYSNVGEIIEVGAGVEGWKVGDRVLTMGHHQSYGILPLGGERPGYIERVPDTVADFPAAFTILGSVAIHGMRNLPSQLGAACAVIGQGVVGQLLVQFAKAAGYYPVIGVDLFAERLKFSKESGADEVVDASKRDAVEAVMQITGGDGVALGLEATRNPNTLNTLLKIAGMGGYIVVVGSLPGTVEISLFKELQFKELTIRGAWQPRAPMQGHHYFPWTQAKNRSVVLDLIANGRLKVEHLLTHRVQSGKAPEMYAMMLRGGTDWMAVAFDWS